MELNLDLGLGFVPKTVSELLREVSRIEDKSLKLLKLDDFLKRLEDEMRKIDAFKRELPLCMLLLGDAIGKLKEELMQCTKSKEQPKIKDFMALDDKSEEDERVKTVSDVNEKKDWMSSVQLWNTDSKQDSAIELKSQKKEEDDALVREKPVQPCNYWKRGGAFVPFKGLAGLPRTGLLGGQEKKVSLSPPSDVPLMGPASKFAACSCKYSPVKLPCKRHQQQSEQQQQQKQKQQQQQQQQEEANRKQRRCWSPELHRRFVEALQRLGGPQAATPKQIREIMEVDGLTNDEVKSHLQKYRLHIQRHPNTKAAPSTDAWTAQDQSGAQSNTSNLHSPSHSPQGPLPANGSAKDISISGGDSTETEEDNTSDVHSSKGSSRSHRTKEVDVQS